MKIIFAGTPLPASIVLEKLVIGGYDIELIITKPDANVGRRQELCESSVAALAGSLKFQTGKEFNILKTENPSDKQIDYIKSLGADIGIVVAYGALLKNSLLEAAKFGWINIHYSLLPCYKGASPLQASIKDGQTPSFSIAKITEKLDSGDIYLQKQYPDLVGRKASDCLEILSNRASSELINLLAHIENGSAVAIPQRGRETYAPKLDKNFGYINFEKMDKKTIYNIYLASSDKPGAFFYFMHKNKQVRIKLIDIALASLQAEAELRKMPTLFNNIVKYKKDIYIKCLDGFIKLNIMQPSGKNAMPAINWFCGL